MVTVIDISNKELDGSAVFEFRGKSSDIKPVVSYGNYNIGNGSTFFEMDTSKLFMFDEEQQAWEEV